MEPWIQTYTGKQFWPLTPKVEDVCIDDIAHALALKCRLGGHCKMFYSVAEHSLRVSRLLKPEHQLIGLMHDAAEAYLPDVFAPIKRQIGIKLRPGGSSIEDRMREHDPERFEHQNPWVDKIIYSDSGLDRFTRHETRVLEVIFAAFAINKTPASDTSFVLPAAVKQADLILLATEARDLMTDPPAPWSLDVPVLPDRIIPSSPIEAEREFLSRFHELTEYQFK